MIRGLLCFFSLFSLVACTSQYRTEAPPTPVPAGKYTRESNGDFVAARPPMLQTSFECHKPVMDAFHSIDRELSEEMNIGNLEEDTADAFGGKIAFQTSDGHDIQICLELVGDNLTAVTIRSDLNKFQNDYLVMQIKRVCAETQSAGT